MSSSDGSHPFPDDGWGPLAPRRFGHRLPERGFSQKLTAKQLKVGRTAGSRYALVSGAYPGRGDLGRELARQTTALIPRLNEQLRHPGEVANHDLRCA